MKDMITSRFGKQYNDEPAVISLTSWRKRIRYVGLTIFSLCTMCPGFHITLVLSEKEFPRKEKELPLDLLLMCHSNIFEILWVHENYKAFKKILFTMHRYKHVPIISADDDCLYISNYAQLLYNCWCNNRTAFISPYVSSYNNTPHLGGAATLYPPNVFGDIGLLLLEHTKIYKTTNQDDDFYTALRQRLNLKNAIKCGDYHDIYIFHDEICPSHDEIKTMTKEQRNELIDKIFNTILLATI